MKCEAVLERLDDFVDGELGPDARDRIRSHLQTCSACRAVHETTLELIVKAGELAGNEAPQRDLWEGIRTRLSEPAAGNRSGYRPWVLAAAVAALILAVVVGPRLAGPAVRPEGISAVEPVGYQEADERFRVVREQLLADLAGGEDRIDPQTARAVRKNLKVMDDAAAEIRKALAADPTHAGLRRMLLASYRHQAKLLTRVREYPDAI